VGSVEDEVVGASFWVLVDGVEGAIEFILDSEVIQFIQHVLGVVREVVQVLQQLFQRRIACLHVKVSLKHGLHAQQLHLEGHDFGPRPLEAAHASSTGSMTGDSALSTTDNAAPIKADAILRSGDVCARGTYRRKILELAVPARMILC